MTKEKSKFNPYYAQLAAKLSNIDRKYRMAAQFAIWDRIKQADSLENPELKNVALFTSKLIVEKVLSLACLKVIEFSEMNKTLVRFLKICLLEIINLKDDRVRKDVFLVVAGYPKLRQLREGLRLFMRHFILKENSKKDKEADTGITDELNKKVIEAEQYLMTGDRSMTL
jgi:nucleolar MIF4G domain-containing protein 1